MARIVKFFELPDSDSVRPHTDVECGYRIATLGAAPILQLQLDIYGSSDRQIPGKVSQSIQIDEQGARQLMALLQRAFPSLGAR
jgi:hypothetical protein